MGVFHLRGRVDQNMVAAGDTNDLLITLPVAPAPTEISLKTYDPKQRVWYSFTGSAGVADWRKVFPLGGIKILVESGATQIYLRKPRNRTPDIFRQTSDDNIIKIEVEYLVRS